MSGPEFTLPVATFSPAWGVQKTAGAEGQIISMAWPLVHMCVYVFYASNLPKEFEKLLLNKRSYISILLNCFTKVHGGEHHVEHKAHLIHGWDSVVTHIGSGECFNFIQRLTKEEAKAVGNIGSMGAPRLPYPNANTIVSDRYEYGQPTYCPTDLLDQGTDAVPASEMYHVSAQNVFVCQSSTR
jgi:hypothetical protein